MDTTFTPPSGSWSMINALKGMTNAAVTQSDADLQGKWVLITGANNGIGRETAIQFARWGANIILACRQPPSHETHPEKVVEECKEAAGSAATAQVFEWWECDMSSFASVEALAARWNETARPLDILVNHAGIAGSPPPAKLTADGFELLHQVNLLSHALLTLSVLPSIARAPSPRVLCTISCIHFLAKYDLSNANSAVHAYANNKLYLQIWLTELQARLLRDPAYAHIAVHGVHPGFVKSGIWGKTPASLISWFLKAVLNLIGVDAAEGSVALTNAATAPEFGLRPAGEKPGEGDGDDEFRGGAKYINRTWVGTPSPYTRHAPFRKEVWDFVAKELGLSERKGVSADLQKLIE